MTSFATAHALHIGGRDEQQDAATVLQAGSGAAHEVLLVLADGMGGHAGGQLASNAVVATAERLWTEGADRSDPGAFLTAILGQAHAEINRIGAEKGINPRSTGVLVYLKGGKATWTHIGDSRLYRFRGDTLLGRTHDHSVVQMLRDMGKISEEEMGSHPDQNRLTHSLGGDTDPEPEIEHADIEPGDSFILCSDGLWEMIRPEEMSAAAAGKLKEQAGTLAASAFARAGDVSDNISIVMARVDAPVVAAAATATPDSKPPSKAKKTARTSGLAFLLVTVIAAGAVAGIFQPWKSVSDTAGPARKSAPAIIPTKQSTGKEAEKKSDGLPDKKGESDAGKSPEKKPAPKSDAKKSPDAKAPNKKAPKKDAARPDVKKGDDPATKKKPSGKADKDMGGALDDEGAGRPKTGDQDGKKSEADTKRKKAGSPDEKSDRGGAAKE